MTAVELLDEIRRVMQLKGENPFKVRAYENAIQSVSGRDDLEERAKKGTLTELPGVGKGISEVLTEFFRTGRSSMLDELKSGLPPGLVELTEIPGLGPKKAMTVIEELGISTVAELEYACRENRLLKLKGFGEKIQAKILEGVQFQKGTQGFRRLDEALESAEVISRELKELAGEDCVCETGELRRQVEVLSKLDFLVAHEGSHAALEKKIAAALERLREKYPPMLPVGIHYVSPAEFGYELARTSATDLHWKALGSPAKFEAKDEDAFFKKLSIEWISPEQRETGEEVELAKSGKLDTVLPWDGVQGIFHNHTTRSDGTASVEEMVAEAKKQGYKYIGISDHSQSAFYANGLTAEVLKAQEKEIRNAQGKYPEIRVFWGIESDILADGSLDYPESVLKKFDFVVASVHSRFKMEKEAMTDRILEAIRNPYTRILGHLTGRILLGRKGYDLHMDRVIAEAAKCDVAIELNANPARLDIDWRWGGEIRKRKTKISVNPDAHATDEIANTRFGVTMARKALIPKSLVINAQSVKDVEAWLKRA